MAVFLNSELAAEADLVVLLRAAGGVAANFLVAGLHVAAEFGHIDAGVIARAQATLTRIDDIALVIGFRFPFVVVFVALRRRLPIDVVSDLRAPHSGGCGDGE